MVFLFIKEFNSFLAVKTSSEMIADTESDSIKVRKFLLKMY